MFASSSIKTSTVTPESRAYLSKTGSGGSFPYNSYLPMSVFRTVNSSFDNRIAISDKLQSNAVLIANNFSPSRFGLIRFALPIRSVLLTKSVGAA